jgi:hypothetical protein
LEKVVVVPKAKKRGFVRFQQRSKRPILSRDEYEYWYDLMGKILKVSTEFELNLPAPQTSMGMGKELPCQYAANPCSRDCANLESCLVERHPTFCETKDTGYFLGKKFKCPAKNDQDSEACKGCPAWMLNCRLHSCAMYTPYCTICPSFQRQGETPEKADIRQDAETVRQEMSERLAPTGFVGAVGATGVLEVKKDNSLQHNGGIEVPTVGRRVHWHSFYQMSKNILESLAERGATANERCGQHYHILCGYLDPGKGNPIGGRLDELEQPMPEIILANLHQLHRRYELAMFWLMSCGTSMNFLTRWAKFRQSIFKYSALKRNMEVVQRELADNIICMSGTNQRGKYASVAYHFCQFNGEGNLEKFHIENRIADGAMSPAVVTAWAMLCYGLVLKAVRLSQYGIMEVGDQEFVTAVKTIRPYLIAGENREWGDNRIADTSELGPYIPWLQQSSRELIQFLKPELNALGPAYEILLSLAERPCSMRLSEGQSWDQVEAELLPSTHRDGEEIEDELRELVDLAGIVDCPTVNIWVEEVAAHLGQEIEYVRNITYGMIESGRYRWSDPIGTLITT